MREDERGGESGRTRVPFGIKKHTCANARIEIQCASISIKRQFIGKIIISITLKQFVIS